MQLWLSHQSVPPPLHCVIFSLREPVTYLPVCTVYSVGQINRNSHLKKNIGQSGRTPPHRTVLGNWQRPAPTPKQINRNIVVCYFVVLLYKTTTKVIIFETLANTVHNCMCVRLCISPPLPFILITSPSRPTLQHYLVHKNASTWGRGLLTTSLYTIENCQLFFE